MISTIHSPPPNPPDTNSVNNLFNRPVIKMISYLDRLKPKLSFTCDPEGPIPSTARTASTAGAMLSTTEISVRAVLAMKPILVSVT